MRHPLIALQNAPMNWVRQTLCLDFFHPPELMPGEALEESGSIWTMLFKMVLRPSGWVKKGVELLVVVPTIIIGILPSLIYRVTFKATSLVYLPLVFVAHTTLSSSLSIKSRLERFTKGELEKVRRWLSWIILGLFVSKVGVTLGLVDLSYLAEQFPSQQLLQIVVAPNSWPWWQFTLLSDAVLTLFLFYFADAAIPQIEGKVWKPRTVENTISSLSFLRGILAIATISHGFYIALIEAGLLEAGTLPGWL